MRAKTEQTESLRKEYDAAAETKLKQAVQSAVAEAQQTAQLQIERERQSAKLELDKARQSTELEVEKAKQTTELETERLRREAAQKASENFNTKIREQDETINRLREQLTMAKQLDTEKKQAQKHWAAQEKILQKVTSSLYGMSGNLQGIAGREIIALPALADDDYEIKAVKPRGIAPPNQTGTDERRQIPVLSKGTAR